MNRKYNPLTILRRTTLCISTFWDTGEVAPCRGQGPKLPSPADPYPDGSCSPVSVRRRWHRDTLLPSQPDSASASPYPRPHTTRWRVGQRRARRSHVYLSLNSLGEVKLSFCLFFPSFLSGTKRLFDFDNMAGGTSIWVSKDAKTDPREIFNGRLLFLLITVAWAGCFYGFDSGNIGGILTLPSFENAFGLSGLSQIDLDKRSVC